MKHRIEVHGTLLNSGQRRGLHRQGMFEELGKATRRNWKLSFDKSSRNWAGAVLNFAGATKGDRDVYYTTVFEAPLSRWAYSGRSDD